jgi:DMSO reductase family type II enzyme heme b subunit
MTSIQTNQRVRAGLMLAAVMALAGLLSLAKVSLVRAAGATITVGHMDAAIPSDPFAAAWANAPVTDVPLSAQQIWQPGGGSVAVVQVRALENGSQIAFLVAWADSTKNDYVRDLPSDAAAIELPLDPTRLPYQCMGQADSRVNIWQWKAALQAEAEASAGAIPFNGTRNLTSNGIGRAVDTDGLHPTGTGTWRDGRWYVVYSRGLADAGPGTAPLLTGTATIAAFAVWDGGKGETRAMKAVSTWTPVNIGAATTNTAGNLLTLAILTVIGIAVIAVGFRVVPRRA